MSSGLISMMRRLANDPVSMIRNASVSRPSTLGGQGLDEAITLVGGASRSNLWSQIVADVTARPVRTLRDDIEASLGAAMLAAIGVGMSDAETLGRRWVDLVQRATPRPAAHSRYEQIYAEYVKLYPALKSTMHSLADTSRQVSATSEASGVAASMA